jgi:hypothetical protein
MGGPRLDVRHLDHAPARARALDFALERQLLELAQQTLLAFTHLGDQRFGGRAVEFQPEPARLLTRPLRQPPAPTA